MKLTTSLAIAIASLLLLGCPATSGSGGEPDDGVEDIQDASAPEPDPGPEPEDDGPEPVDEGPPPVDEGPPPPTCDDGLPIRAFDALGPFGTLRHELAADFTVTRLDGIEWTLSETWSGCEVYVFVPDTLPNSPQDTSSVWERDALELVKGSPPNVHYFFVSRQGTDGGATTNTEALFERIGEEFKALPQEEADAWWFRLHVVEGRAGTLADSWLSKVLTSGVGQLGFAIDRFQRIRGIGSLADVFRYNSPLAAAEAWPWEANLAYAANDARYLNAQAKMLTAAEAVDATVVGMWAGEVIEGFAEMDVDLPDAATMEGFDTFEIDVSQRCPNPNLPELGNCGAWDYLAHLSVYSGEDERVELGRFITTYHREARWIHDVTPMMAKLLEGGTRKLRWEWAPEWNKQPTATWLNLRFSNQDKGLRPGSVAWLYGSASFNASYGDQFVPMEVAVPADAVKTELYAVISGHGAEASQCAEFCAHQHEWTVNGEIFLEEHLTVGQQDGCVQELENQMTPNQYGTWWFGRGGWCPGQPVTPWVVDVTEHVEPGGMASVSYRGLLGGQPPPDGAGEINMTSYLVFYR